MTITQLDPIAVAFTLPQRDLPGVLAALRAGNAPVQATLPDDRGALTGRLQFVDNAVDAASGTVKVKAVFDNRDLRLWPGAFVNVALSVQTLDGVVVLPQAADRAGRDGQDGVRRRRRRQGRAAHGRSARVGRHRGGGVGRRAGQPRRRRRQVQPAPGQRGARARRRRARAAPGAAAPAGAGQRRGVAGQDGAVNLSELFIRRPVMTVLLNAAIVLAGVIAWGRIPVAALPSYNTPVINVFAALPGASPETMAASVALPLEKQFQTIPGLAVDQLEQHARAAPR